MVQFGGQTAINLAQSLVERGVKILGTSLESLDRAENRDKFEQALQQLNIRQPLGKKQHFQLKKHNHCKGYRLSSACSSSSYVLGGRAMEIVYQEKELFYYMQHAVQVNPEHPVLI